MNTVPHDGDELSIGQSAVAICIEEEENGADDMRAQRCSRTAFNSTLEFIYCTFHVIILYSFPI